ncbi:MAG: NAD(P)-dependent oxidoreductase [Alphaproteobacteria bacterium]|nr:NAD(P)-dependent oxidoreductase [Alphaproteobacteria bacterium]
MAREIIGLVGPGRMGYAMLKHLIAKGYGVTVTDINADNIARAIEAGAEGADSPAALGAVSDFVIIAVGFDHEALAVTLGDFGLLQSMGPGSVIAVSSTVAPETVQRIESEAAKKNVGVLDAPICRGGWAADEGTLLALFGGGDEVVERAKPIYSAFSSDIVHIGSVGHGQVAKTMNNMLLWVNGIALMEAGRLSESTGIDLPKLREALLMSSGRSAALEDWDMITFTWALKDMQIVSQMADKAGITMPLAGAIKEMVKDGKTLKQSGGAPDWTGKAKS